MADNDISPQTLEELIGYSGYNIITWILFVLNLAAAIYGVTSWCFIRKFRHFRNYVFISANTARMLMLLFYSTEESIQSSEVRVYTAVLIMYCELSFRCWLLVLCYMFYVDFVKVFSLDIRRRYLKSSLFAWGLPLMSNLLFFVPPLFFYFYVSSKIITQQMLYILVNSILLIPVASSFVIYLTVLFCLCCVSKAGANVPLTKWRRFYISTFIFVLSNIIVLPSVFLTFGTNILSINVILELGAILNTVALAVYLIILKSNRELWREFLDKRLKQKSLEMK